MLGCAIAGHGAVLFSEDFSRGKAGAQPAGLLVLGGDFRIRHEGKEHFLELAGKPVNLHAAMFGPPTQSSVRAEVRVRGQRRGRRAFPAFGLGLNGVSGYRLMVSPAKGKLELFKADTPVRAVPFQWKHDAWTHLRLELAPLGKTCQLTAWAWAGGDKAPDKPTLEWRDLQPPLPGRATIWGAPFAGTPIRFDDLRMRRLD